MNTLLEYEVINGNGDSSVHKRTFDNKDSAELFLSTARVMIQSRGGKVLKPTYSDTLREDVMH